MDDCVLTTYDNPWNPYTHWDEWYAYDMFNKYNTCGLLAEVAKTSNELSDRDNEEIIDQAMKEIVSFLPFLYRIVYKKDAAILYSN